MVPTQRIEFGILTLENRSELLQTDGEYIKSRQYGSYSIYLYSVRGFFVEMWVLNSLNKLQWIEIQDNNDVLFEYVEDINVYQELVM